MTGLRRIRLRRIKGWRMPANTVKVARPTKWGNPFEIGVHGTRQEVLRKYRAWIMQKLTEQPDFLAPLRGKNLACFCKMHQPCHADILLELANRENLAECSNQHLDCRRELAWRTSRQSNGPMQRCNLRSQDLLRTQVKFNNHFEDELGRVSSGRDGSSNRQNPCP